MKELLASKKERFKHLVESGEKSPAKLAVKTTVSIRVVNLWLKEYFNEGKELPTKVVKQIKRKLRKEQKSDIQLRRERRRSEFKKLYLSRNYTIEEIANKMEVGRTTIHNWIRKDFPEGARWRYKEFVTLYETDQFTIERIAGLLGCVRASAVRYLARYRKENGLPPGPDQEENAL